ncbi:hypothetical protein [Paraburkholderia acidisoli]|uniref:hypothetical protein n=1 Tax=Paraburkholderia acidisoli TaxID=2571748 RepID=UPI00131AB0E6|nr:hypothetical protein [Paraburkholderia acidisoli]
MKGLGGRAAHIGAGGFMRIKVGVLGVVLRGGLHGAGTFADLADVYAFWNREREMLRFGKRLSSWASDVSGALPARPKNLDGAVHRN